MFSGKAHFAFCSMRSDHPSVDRSPRSWRDKRGKAYVTNSLNFARKALRGGTALQALALLGAGVGMVAVAAPAVAQDYTNVTASGRVQGTDGRGIGGATVEIASNDQGYRQTVTTDSSGGFRLPQVRPGTYTFTVSAQGYDTFVDASVPLGQGAAANQFTLAPAGAAAGGDIVVTAGRVQVADFERTTTGAVINIGDLATRVPVARTLRDVILLAPGTTQGQSAQNAAFGGQATIGGSSFAENAYYVNGLNITEFRQGFSPVAIPFDFYQTVDVKSGGFQAEFGRATGGVVVATTKSGTNDFHGSVLFNWEPNALRDRSPNTYAADNDSDRFERKESVFQLSGPIIKDHLFFYGIYNSRDVQSSDASLGAANVANNRQTVDRNTSPFFGGKLDAVIVDGQRLEFTYFDSTSITNRRTYVFNTDTNTAGRFVSGTNIRAGGENYVGRYTGTFAPWLTLSAAYGVNKNRAGGLPLDTVNPRVIDNRTGTAVDVGLNTTASTATNDDKREFYRGDADLFVKLLGSHHFRFGYDREKLTATQISQTIGGGLFNIFTVTSANDSTRLPIGTQYVTARTFVNGGAFETVNDAFYLQDSWSLFGDRLSLQLGIRNDRFNNKDAGGKSFYKSGDQWGPRLGFTFDPVGDGRSKVYGSFSRYFVPIAANTNIRGAGSELDYTRYNLLGTGFASNGAPILGAPILTVANSRACPDTGTVNCTVVKNGSIQDPSSFIAQGLKPQSMDEYIIGGEQRIGSRIRVGAYFTYRKLNEVLEDAAIDIAANNYCISRGFSATACGNIYTGFSQYVLVNPGRDAAIKLIGLPDGTTPTVNFTAAQLGYPRAVRDFKSMTFTFDREFDGKWSIAGSYTLAASVGNYEGGVKSDIGQADTGATQDFDQPGFTIGAYGYLPNHRRHTFKAYGSYQLGEMLTLGANAFVQSPKKFGCLGVVPRTVDPYAADYQGGGYFCQGVATPRGRSFESQWRKEFNLSLQLRVPTDFDASIRFDVFNVFNDKSQLDFDEEGDLASGSPNPNYRAPLVYQAPRSARVQFRVGF